jgi:hypothetical protein
MSETAPLDCLGVPAATAKLASFFALNGTARPTVRELQRTLGLASASVQRDLDRLVRTGALVAKPDGRLVRYVVRPESRVWTAVRLLVGDAPAPDRVREKAARYGVDVGHLRSMMRLSPEERLTQLDANVAFLGAARASRTRRRS